MVFAMATTLTTLLLLAIVTTTAGGNEQIEAVKTAALQQGVAYAPLGPDGDNFGLKDLESTVTAVFEVNDTMTVKACGRRHLLAASGQTIMKSPPSTTSTITTDQTRVMPTVEWNCQQNKLYSMIMYDAFALPITNTSFGFTHWIKINIPCDPNTATAASTEGVTFGKVGYFQPDNFGLHPNNYGFYILEQRQALAPTQAELARYDRARLNNGVALRQFMEWVSDKGPIARTWARIKVSVWSAFALETAGLDFYSAIACGNLGMTDLSTQAKPAADMTNAIPSTLPVKNTRTLPAKNKTFDKVAPDSQQQFVFAAITSIIALVYPFIKSEN